MKIIESVPNFSEGTNQETVNAILDAFRNTRGVRLLDSTYDSNYNRLVVTIIGSPKAVEESLLYASDIAIERIDMRNHKGQHPRMGAVDVVPFIPIRDVTMDECVRFSKSYGRRVSQKHNLPVFLYDESGRNEKRRDIDFLRRGEFEGLTEALKDKERKPDFGPAVPHPTAGATATGARGIMVGLNVNLSTPDLQIAKKIAKAIRAKSGGLANIKAMAARIEKRNITQLGITNVNFIKTPLYRQLELIRIEAERYNVRIIGSEFCGMVPLDALISVVEYYLKLENFKREQVIDIHIPPD